MTAEHLVTRTAEIIRDKLGEDVVVLDLHDHYALTDYFVIATASSTIHAQAIATEVVEKLAQEGERVHHIEGVENARWILLDYVDVVVHILLSDIRLFYGLERLWGDAPKRSFPSEDNLSF
ncbi:ribosome silencing factor [candidate division WOR-3 bacterium JGI_Cruoil_03_51_56]|uniref:Ribosomal silencing factor RsfS n=1 Tax=candidate division WOR-3 bacterium JGI_Cruoil_03_51_56 TaxID=1973747 RepID=A0A235BS58_UNCW3|nr:MAG: ribosome silencing factor [candidate division WOR-3 bacterium JGI_Cruoil_03_51_56]